MSAILFIGLVVAVLWLAVRLSETRYQLGQRTIERDNARFHRDQALHEIDTWERIYNEMCEGWVSGTMPRPRHRAEVDQ